MSVTTNDALGGAGSLSDALRGIALNGLSRAIDGYAAKKYPLTYFNEPNAVDAEGNVRPRSAPGTPVTTGEAAKAALTNPLVIGVGVAVLASVALFFVLRK